MLRQASCSGNRVLREDTLDSTNDGNGNDSEVEGLCDALQFPSPLKTQTAVKEQAYELLKHWFDALVPILDDSVAVSQRLSHFTSKVSEVVRSHAGENGSCCPIGQANGSNCVQCGTNQPKIDDTGNPSLQLTQM